MNSKEIKMRATVTIEKDKLDTTDERNKNQEQGFGGADCN